MATAKELREQAEQADWEVAKATVKAADLKRQADKLEREERQTKRAAEQREHYDRMFREVGSPLAGLNEKQHAIVYAQAWQHGSGYDEVSVYYGDFAEMARKILEER